VAKAPRKASAIRDMAVAAVLALLSGVACYFMFDPDSLASWLLGIPFAIAAGIAAFVAWRPEPARLAAGSVVIALAWALAYWAVQDTLDPIDKALRFMADSGAREQLGFALAFNVGNLVGGGLTILGLGLAAGRFMAVRHWLLTLAIGAVVVFADVYVVAGDQANQAMFLFLFPAWQLGMVLSILWGTTRTATLEAPGG
jgi:hypothetical protein